MNTNFHTLELAIELHQKVMKIHLPGFRSDQILRSSQSVALNLAEGAGRFTKNEKRRFYRIAYGSLKETIVLLRLANVQDQGTLHLADRVGASVYKLIRSLNNR
jgi:four helix bundle protein